MPRLIIERPGAQPRICELTSGATVRIGRAAENEIVLPDSSISRRHATLSHSPAGWVIVDEKSANGVLVNGARVEKAQLKSNDLISLGDCKLRFEHAESGTVVAQAPPQLATRLTQILDQESVAKILEKPKSKPETEWTERRVDAAGRIAYLQRENRLLSLLYQVSRALGDKTTVEEVSECVLDLVLQIDGAERGSAMLLNEESLRDGKSAQGNFSFLPAILRYRRTPAAETPQMTLSRAIIRQVMESNGPLLVMDAKADARFSGSQSMALSGMQSAMCAPLACRDRLFGLLYVDNLSKRGTFTPEELEIFAVIAAQAGLAIDRVRVRSEVRRQGVQLSALERFLSPGISQKIAAEAANLRLGGEGQRITVLFADVRGFTTLAEKMTPQDAVGVLNAFFTRMTDVIFEHDGTLDKYLGDGLMALFGAPLAQENDAEAAVRAAMAMQMSLEELNRESGSEPLRIGIGIHTGEAVVGFLGTERRMDYTAIGDTVNVASRLTSQAGPGQIIISTATGSQINRDIARRRMSPMKLKGRAGLIEVLEVLWKEAHPQESTARKMEPYPPQTP